MRFRTGLIVGAALGYAAAQWLRKDDPTIVTAPREPQRAQSAAARLVTEGSRRLAERAQTASLDALQRARGNIQARIGDGGDASWN
jgi:outer membrane cobalamin receptor